MVGLLKLKTLQRRVCRFLSARDLLLMLNHLVFNENMTSWLLFFFHMANWKMRLFDLYFNYTPSDLSPLHFLSNMNSESKHTLTFPISPASWMAKKKFNFFTFLWFTCDLQRFKANSFPPSWRAREALPIRGETAWLCNHPPSTAAPWHPAFSMESMEGELFHVTFRVTGVAIIR